MRSSRSPAHLAVWFAVGDFGRSGFSVLPPQGEQWCIFARSTEGVQFGKNLFGGRLLETAPSRGEMAHSFFARAQALDPKQIDRRRPEIGSMTDLRALVEALRADEGGIKTVAWQASEDRSLGLDCVRFDMMQEQRDHPQYRGDLRILSKHGLVCRHPFLPQRVILVDYSERYLQAQVARGSPGRVTEREGRTFYPEP